MDWAVVCKSFAEDFRKMGGEIFLNFEVSGFAEMAESKGKSQLAPISVQSKTRVRFSSLHHILLRVLSR